MIRAFDAPSPNWTRGHRGVDLAGSPGQPVYAAGTATVVYAGTLAGRELVSLAHPGGLHTSYEPVRAAVRAGQSVTAGTAIGELLAGHAGLSRRGVPALGRDVGSCRPRRLRRSTGTVGVHTNAAEAAASIVTGCQFGSGHTCAHLMGSDRRVVDGVGCWRDAGR